jgi:hypothetical protein
VIVKGALGQDGVTFQTQHDTIMARALNGHLLAQEAFVSAMAFRQIRAEAKVMNPEELTTALKVLQGLLIVLNYLTSPTLCKPLGVFWEGVVRIVSGSGSSTSGGHGVGRKDFFGGWGSKGLPHELRADMFPRLQKEHRL